MKILSNVKQALFISLFLMTFESQGFSVVPQMGCGLYLVQGTIGLNNQQSFVLRVQENTSSPYELILLGGDSEEKMRRMGQPITAEVYAFKPIKGNNNPTVLFQRYSDKSLKAQSPVVLLKEESCGQRSRYIKSFK